jgi:hypothetical protein
MGSEVPRGTDTPTKGAESHHGRKGSKESGLIDPGRVFERPASGPPVPPWIPMWYN